MDREAAALAVNIIESAIAREADAIRSLHAIHTGSSWAARQVDAEIDSWSRYGDALRNFVLQRAAPDLPGGLDLPGPTAEELAFHEVVPHLSEEIRGREFNMGRFQPAQEYFRDHPGILAELALSNNETSQIMNYVNGERSVLTIRNRVMARTGSSALSVGQVARYLEILEEIGWVRLERTR
jgi:hypothetical protein